MSKLKELGAVTAFLPAGLFMYFVAESLSPDYINRSNLHYYNSLVKSHLTQLRRNRDYRTLIKIMNSKCASYTYIVWRRDFGEKQYLQPLVSQVLFSENIRHHVQNNDIDIVRLDVALRRLSGTYKLTLHYQLESLRSGTVARSQIHIPVGAYGNNCRSRKALFGIEAVDGHKFAAR